MYNGKERRRYRRVKAEVSVDIERYGSEPMMINTLDAASKNVSAAGLLVKFDKPLPMHAMVLARFQLPGEAESLEVVARTVRCIPVEGGYDIGLEFLDSMPQEVQKIEHYVQSETEEPKP